MYLKKSEVEQRSVRMTVEILKVIDEYDELKRKVLKSLETQE